MNRRKFLLASGSVVALAFAPSAAMALPATPPPFVPPTTNVVHLAGRIGQKCLFSGDDVLHMPGLDPTTIKAVEREPHPWDGGYEYSHYDRVDAARSLAERGAHDVYERARLVIDIRRKLNLHFNFMQDDQLHWLDKPNRLLQDKTFREVMMQDLRHAAHVIDFALQG